MVYECIDIYVCLLYVCLYMFVVYIYMYKLVVNIIIFGILQQEDIDVVKTKNVMVIFVLSILNYYLLIMQLLFKKCIKVTIYEKS